MSGAWVLPAFGEVDKPFFTRIAEEKIRKELNLYKLQVLEKYHIYYIIDNKYGELYNLKLKQ